VVAVTVGFDGIVYMIEGTNGPDRRRWVPSS
jgi:hypothetical protein